MIFMNPSHLSLSSLATGPNTRVPLGVPSSLIKTIALSENLMSTIRTTDSNFVRTITPLTISPFNREFGKRL